MLSEIHRRKGHQNHQQYYYHEQVQVAQFVQAEESFGWNMESSPLSPSPKASSTTDTLTALVQDNQRLRRKNYMLVSELTHMKNLYNDIIFFIQNHVKPVPKASSLGGPKIVELGPSIFPDPIHSGTTETAKSSGLGKSSLTLLTEEPNNRTVKLFGFPLSSNN